MESPLNEFYNNLNYIDDQNQESLSNINSISNLDLHSLILNEERKYGTFKSDQSSEYNVILNDGTMQKRTISLSNSFDFNSYKSSLFMEYKPLIRRNISGIFNESEPTSSSESIIFRGNKEGIMGSFLNKLTVDQKDVIKASFSHFIGTLFTFVPILHYYIGNASHLVAITCIFFNPGQSIGKFIENMIFGFFLVLFGLVVGCLSIFNTALWNDLGFHTFARFSTWFVFIGGYSFILARIKAQYPKSSVMLGIAASFMITYLVLLNRTPFVGTTFDTTDTYNLAKGLAVGILLNFIICTQLWPRWESDKLKTDMVLSLDSLKYGLCHIVKTFLLEENGSKDINEVNEIIINHRNLQSTLNTRYEASSWEFQLNSEKYAVIGKTINKLNEMGQKLNGLSSSIETQKELLELSDKDVSELLHSDIKLKNRNSIFIENNLFNQNLNSDSQPDLFLFSNFLKYIAPPTKSLTYTCRQAISVLALGIRKIKKNSDLHSYSDNSINVDEYINTGIPLCQLKKNIKNALTLFSEARNQAINTLYTKAHYDGHPSEEVFLVYFFVYELEDFANELLSTIEAFEIMEELSSLDDYSLWENLKYHFFSTLSNIKSYIYIYYNNLLALITGKRDYSGVNTENIDKEPLHNPKPQTSYQRSRANFWYFLMSLRDYRVIFALKASFASLLISSPAYLFGYHELFRDWKVGWTLVAMNIVMSPTLGTSNLFGLYRVIGTISGSLVGYLTYAMFSENVYALVIMTSLVTVPCMHIFLKTSVPKFGQFLLLCYNLIVLTSYINKENENFGFARYAFIRATSVTIGVLFGLFFSLVIMPYEARRELRVGLSRFISNFSQIYYNMYQLCSISQETLEECGSTPNFNFKKMLQSFSELEIQAQKDLFQLEALLPSTAHEPRLKGPFPINNYKDMLNSCQSLLRQVNTIKMLISHSEWNGCIAKDFLTPLELHHSQLNEAVQLYIYMLYNALLLRTPLPPYLPAIHSVRKKMIISMQSLDKQNFLSDSQFHYIPFYAYIVVLNDILDELEKIADNLKVLFGVYDIENFDKLFLSFVLLSNNGAWIDLHTSAIYSSRLYIIGGNKVYENEPLKMDNIIMFGLSSKSWKNITVIKDISELYLDYHPP
ncbi:hypothetical protein K502DRAFT_362057 [Neoconidiobolus thromboides FSU 785]|nr:hypothetical protein K502DRAFT_362057 [Neoconidiobolus thromboides FSU 785]